MCECCTCRVWLELERRNANANNSPRFNPCITRQIRILVAAEKAVLNKFQKIQSKNSLWIKIFIGAHFSLVGLGLWTQEKSANRSKSKAASWTFFQGHKRLYWMISSPLRISQRSYWIHLWISYRDFIEVRSTGQNFAKKMHGVYTGVEGTVRTF